MAKPDPDTERKERSRTIRWVVTIFLVTIVVSGVISLISDEVMENSGMAVAFLILLIIVMVGIIFDIIGVAVTSADEKPFHSMAARKVPGAKESIKLLRNAERVSSICNDVVGDICFGYHRRAGHAAFYIFRQAGDPLGHVGHGGGPHRRRKGHRQDLCRPFLHEHRVRGGKAPLLDPSPIGAISQR